LKLKIVIEGKAYEVEVAVANEAELDPSTPVSASIQSTVLPTAAKPGAGSGDIKVIRSPLAGLVARVNVTPGQDVQPREVLMVLEAMKMESNVIAQLAGRIKTVDVAPGQAVKVDQELVHFE
jgi:oxaloacetate decarboxylase alpha subunit